MDDPAYEQAWASLRRRVRLWKIADDLWILPVAVFAVGIVGFELVPNTLDWRGPLWWTFLLLLAAAWGLRMLANRRMRSFRCPRCGGPFVKSLSTVERRLPCQHCQLPVGAAPGDP